MTQLGGVLVEVKQVAWPTHPPFEPHCNVIWIQFCVEIMLFDTFNSHSHHDFIQDLSYVSLVTEPTVNQPIYSSPLPFAIVVICVILSLFWGFWWRGVSVDFSDYRFNRTIFRYPYLQSDSWNIFYKFESFINNYTDILVFI